MNYTGLRHHNENEQQKQTLQNMEAEHLNPQAYSGSNPPLARTLLVVCVTRFSKSPLQYHIVCYLQLSQKVKSMTTDWNAAEPLEYPWKTYVIDNFIGYSPYHSLQDPASLRLNYFVASKQRTSHLRFLFCFQSSSNAQGLHYPRQNKN